MNLRDVGLLCITALGVTGVGIALPPQGACVRNATQSNPCAHLATPTCESNCYPESTVEPGAYCASQSNVVPESTGTWNNVTATSKAGIDGYTTAWVLCTKIYPCQIANEPIICADLSQNGEVMVQCKRWAEANLGHYYLTATAGGPGTVPCNQTQTNPN